MPEEQCHVLCKIFKNACFAPQRTDYSDRVPDRNFCLISPAEQLSNLGQLIQLLQALVFAISYMGIYSFNK